MKKIATLIVMCGALPLFARPAFDATEAGFIENKGQIINQSGLQNASVLYLHNGKNMNIQLRRSGFSYDVWVMQNDPSGQPEDELLDRTKAKLHYLKQFHRIDVEFERTNPGLTVSASEASHDYLNYYNEYTGSKGVRVWGYRQVVYKNVWDKIDVVFHISDEGKVKYNYMLHPGGQIADIKFRIQGADSITATNKSLKLWNNLINIQESLPYSFYTLENNHSGQAGIQNEIIATFKKNGDGSYGISYTGAIPPDATVVIDPYGTPDWISLYGGDDADYGYAIDADSEGNIFFTGATKSADNIATSGAYQSVLSGNAFTDCFIAKFNTDGIRQWGTYIGEANASDDALALTTVKSSGEIYITGYTQSPDIFGTPGAHQEHSLNSGNDVSAFLTKFDSSGALMWSTYYGGIGDGIGYGLALDASDNVYVAGRSESLTGISTPGAFKENIQGPEGFIAKFNKDGQRVWGTYYGGNYEDEIRAITIKQNKLYVGGMTKSTDNIATSGAYQMAPSGSEDAFVGVLDTAGARLWGSYFGAFNEDELTAIAADTSGTVYIAGYTYSTSGIATSGTVQPTFGGGYTNGFLAKFNNGGSLSWSTYYGGTGQYDKIMAVAVGNSGNIYIGGQAQSNNNIATPGTYAPTMYTAGNYYTFLAKFHPSGQRIWGTYLKIGTLNALSLDNNNHILMTGMSTGSIATPGAHQTVHGGGISTNADAFVMKIKGCSINFATASSNSPVTMGNTINLHASGGLDYSWTGPGGFTSNVQNPQIQNAGSNRQGTYVVTVSDAEYCLDTAHTDVVVQDSATSVREFEKNQIVVYPNPAQEHFVISQGNNIHKTLSIHIYSMDGKEVMHLTSDKKDIIVPVNNIAPGLYYYRFSDAAAQALIKGGTITITK